MGRTSAASCSPYVAMLAWHVLEIAGHMLLTGGQHTRPVQAEDRWDKGSFVFSEMCFGPLIASAAFAATCGTLLPTTTPASQVAETDYDFTLSSMRHSKGRRADVPSTGDTDTKILDMLALLSVAWNILKVEDDMPLPNPYGVKLKMVVGEVDRWMTAHGLVALRRTRYLQQIPVRYPLKLQPRGQYVQEAPLLEQIELDMNNILSAQYGRCNPVAYRILPTFLSVHTEIMSEGTRRLLVDCGAGGAFADGTKVLLDMYSGLAPFTEALLIDPQEHTAQDRRKMQEYSTKHAVNITTLKANLRVGTRDASSDVLSILDDMRLARNDFVVLKFDCDDLRESDSFSLEWGFLADLVTSQRHLDLVDEIYVEMHFFYPYMFGKAFPHHSMWQAWDLMRQLRGAGIAIHAWP